MDNYVDDARSYTRVFKPGTRYEKSAKKFVIREEERLNDLEAKCDLVRMTQEQYPEALNDISPSLKLTLETFGDFEDGVGVRAAHLQIL